MLLWVNIFLLVIEFLLLKKINKLFTPLGLFVLIWLIALLFLPFAEEYYSYKVSDRFYLFYLALTSVNIFLLVFSGNNNKNVERKQYDRKYLSKLGRANDLVLILTTLWVGLFFIDVFRKYSVLWLVNPVELREMFFDGRADLIVGASYSKLLLYLSTFFSCALIFYGNKKKRLYLPVFLALMFATAYLGRNEFFKVIMMYVCALHTKYEWSMKRWIMIGGTLFFVLIFMSSLLNKENRYADNRNSFISAIEAIGCYASGSIIAFDDHISTSTELTYGTSTFYPLLRRLGSQVSPPNYTEDYIGNINTFTYLRPFYDDYGAIGILFLVSLFNWILIIFSVKLLRYSSIYMFVIYISIFPVALFSIQGFELQSIEFFSSVLYCLIICYLCNFKFIYL